VAEIDHIAARGGVHCRRPHPRPGVPVRGGIIVGKLFGRQLELGIVNAIERLARELK
jgi:hypothetical protein